ncbi:MAG: methyltransferase, partial [Hyphomicrobium sp.]
EMCLNNIDLIKIDIEGYEDKALIPFFKEAPRKLYPKAIIIENNEKDWETDVISYACSLGYKKIVIPTSNNIILSLI